MLAVKRNRYTTLYKIIYCLLRGQQLIFSDDHLVKGVRVFREFSVAIKMQCIPIYITKKSKGKIKKFYENIVEFAIKIIIKKQNFYLRL